MEKRALLALVLSLAVFVGWGYFLASVRGPAQKGAVSAKPGAQQSRAPATAGVPQAPATAGAEAQAPTAAGTDATVPAASGAAEAPAPQAVPESVIGVSAGWVSYGVSTRGGVIKELLVQKYHDASGKAINLVAHENGGAYPLSLESSDVEITRILQTSVYEASATALQLDAANPSATLTLTLRHPLGIEVVREYTFHFNSYLVDLKTRIAASGLASRNAQYNVLWGPKLGGGTESRAESFIHTGPTAFVNNERLEIREDELPEPVHHQGTIEWTAFQNKYFATALMPGSGIKSTLIKKMPGGAYVGLEMESVQSSASAAFQLYAGTKELQLLEQQEHKLVRLIDYGWLGNKFAFLVKPLLKILQYFHGIFNNYGWAIIVLTVCVKLLFFPLTHASFKSMRGMMKIQPYVKIIQERNKDDRNKLNEELMDLYRKHKVNPLGGCLPMLLQIPVFIALYHALFFSIELRGAPFLFWIRDLSESDPYYITPIFMGVTMILQQKMTPSAGDPMQQKIMMFMPVMFTFMFLSFPSGLVIYWTVNNLLTIAQQFYIYKIAKD